MLVASDPETWRLIAPKQAALLLEEARTALPAALLAKLSPPFFVAAPPEWNSSKHRLLIYGQETNGWAEGSVPGTLLECATTPNAVERLRAHYQGFDFATYYRHRRSPFWAAFRELADKLEGGDCRKLLWSNLVKVDAGPATHSGSKSVLKRLTADEVEAIIAWQRPLLYREISESGAGAVLFFTGPNYDDLLAHCFDASIISHQDFERRAFARVVSHRLPVRSFRTYHPTYLRRARRWRLLGQIAEIIADETESGLTT